MLQKILQEFRRFMTKAVAINYFSGLIGAPLCMIVPFFVVKRRFLLMWFNIELRG